MSRERRIGMGKHKTANFSKGSGRKWGGGRKKQFSRKKRKANITKNRARPKMTLKALLKSTWGAMVMERAEREGE